MTLGVEHYILIITTLAGVLKAYFEAQKAKAEAMRADIEQLRADEENERAGEAEELLKVAVKGVEEARKDNPQVVSSIKKYTEALGVDSKFHAIVKEITEGEGNVQKHTRSLSKTKLRRVLEEDA